MASGIEEILTTLYEMVQDAWSLPLGADKCVLERDKVLDLLDEISNQLPGELKQAKTIVESRNEVITNAKREAENILKQAEQRARQMISHEEVYLQAQKEADDLMKNAQARPRQPAAGQALAYHRRRIKRHFPIPIQAEKRNELRAAPQRGSGWCKLPQSQSSRRLRAAGLN